MGNRENQAKAELAIFEQAMRIARSKGGEARRNVDRIAGRVELYDRPDILIRGVRGKVVGIEHFRVDQLIAHGRKKESKAAEFCSYAEGFRKSYESDAKADGLPEGAYAGFGEMFSRSIKLNKDSCVDDIAESLNCGLFGEGGRGHAPKLKSYMSRLQELGHDDASLGLLIEFHTDLER